MLAPEARSPYAVPLTLGVMSIAGLLMALLGEGGWHVAAWVLLAAPAAAIVRALTRGLTS